MSPQHEGEAASLTTSRHTRAGYAGIPATPAPHVSLPVRGKPSRSCFSVAWRCHRGKERYEGAGCSEYGR